MRSYCYRQLPARNLNLAKRKWKQVSFLTVLANLSGLPALTLPWGIQGGIQLLGRAFDEETLFRLGYFIELEGGRNE